jgi:cytochrome c oxidase subunit 3
MEEVAGHGDAGGRHEVELSAWPLVVGICSFLIPMAFITAFEWKSSMLGLVIAGVAVVFLVMGLFGWVSEIYSRNQHAGLSSTAILIFIGSEVTLFGGLFSSYLYSMLDAPSWPPVNTPAGIPPLGLALVLSVVLLSSSATIQVAETRLEHNDMAGFKTWLFVTFALGLAFICGQAVEWTGLIANEHFTISTNTYSTFFFTITGFHGSHVVVGLLLQAFILILAVGNRITAAKSTIIRATGYYWHFVDVVWLMVLALIYIIPHLKSGA